MAKAKRKPVKLTDDELELVRRVASGDSPAGTPAPKDTPDSGTLAPRQPEPDTGADDMGRAVTSGMADSFMPPPREQPRFVPGPPPTKGGLDVTRDMIGRSGIGQPGDPPSGATPLSARLAFDVSDRQIEEDFQAGAKGGSEFERSMVSFSGALGETLSAANDLAGRPLGDAFDTTQQMAQAARAEGGVATRVGQGAGYLLDPVAVGADILTGGAARAAGLTARGGRLGARIADEALIAGVAEGGTALIRGDQDPKTSALLGAGAGGTLASAFTGVGALWRKTFPNEPLPSSPAVARQRLEQEGVLEPQQARTDAPAEQPASQQATEAAETPRAASEAETTPTPRPEPEADAGASRVSEEQAPARAAEGGEAPPLREEALSTPEARRDVEQLEAEGVPREQAEALVVPEMELGAGLTPQGLRDVVEGAMGAGRWTARASASASRYAMDRLGAGISTMREFARRMIGEFGRGIRKHIPEVWKRYGRMRDVRGRATSPAPAPAPKPRSGQADAERQAFREAFRGEASSLVSRRLGGDTLAGRALAGRASRVRSQSGLDRLARDIQARVEVGEGVRGPKEARNLISRAFGKKATSPLRLASRNSDFKQDFEAIKRLGIDQPGRVPTQAELAKLTPQQRLEVVSRYDDIKARFAAFRRQRDVVQRGAKAGAESAREIVQKGRREVPVGRSSGQRNSSWAKQFFRNFSLQPERLAGRLGSKARETIYDPINNAKTEYYRRYRSYLIAMTDELREAGIDPGDSAVMNRLSGAKAPRMTLNVGGKAIPVTRAEFHTLLATLTDTKSLDEIVGGAPITLGRDRTDATRARLSEQDIETIDGMATEEDWQAVRAIKRVINGDVSSDMNTIHRELRGVDLSSPDRKDYFPQMRDVRNTVGDADEMLSFSQDPRVENRPMTKRRKEGSKQPIVINDIYSVADRHLAQAAAIVEMSKPVKQVQATLGNRAFADSVRRFYGDDMLKAMDSYVQDVVEDAGRFASDINEIEHGFSRFVSNIGVGVLGANPTVVLKQTPSFINAMVEIDEKYMAEGAKSAFDMDNRANMIRHSPQIWARYNLHASRLIGDMRAEAEVLAKTRTISEAMMEGITQADKAVLSSIWKASELKVRAEKPNLSGDEFWGAVNSEADRVIRRTQPNFDMVNASWIQRQGRKSGTLKAVSMFMSQRNTNYNMLYEAVASGDRKKLAKTLAVVAIIQPAMIAAVDDLRDFAYGRSAEDQSVEGYAARYTSDIVGNNVSQVYLGSIAEPAVRKFLNKQLGQDQFVFDYSVPPLAVTESFLSRGVGSAAEGLAEGDSDKLVGGIERIILDGSAMKGIPLRSPYTLAARLAERLEGDGEGASRPERPERPPRPQRPERPPRPARP